MRLLRRVLTSSEIANSCCASIESGRSLCFSFHLYSLQQSPEEAEEARGKRITGALIHIEYSSRGANE